MRKVITKARVAKSALLSACFLVLLAVPAFAQTTSTTDSVKNAVTPYFTDLKNFATDMIPLVLGVAIVGIAFGLGRSWLRRAKG